MSLATHESVSAKTSGAARLDVVPLTKHIGAEVRGIEAFGIAPGGTGSSS